ncbi:MAG: ATP-binding protein, partial [Bacteroidota bacterium]
REQGSIIQKERRRNKLLMDRQLEMQQTKNEISLLLAEQEQSKLKLRQADLEQQKKEKELELSQSQLAILKKENELQNEKYRNKDLESRQIAQMLEILKQKSMAAEQQQKAVEQQQKIDLLQKEKIVQQLQLDKRKEDILQLEREKQQNSRIKTYNISISILLFLLLMVAIQLYLIRNKRNKLLTQHNATISRMNTEITTQNEELVSINEQLNDRTNELHEQNLKMASVQEIIREQNDKLRLYNKNLEDEVERRTKEIMQNNSRLLDYNEQMEKFTYAISHNLRAPIARLLGLVNVVDYASAADQKYILEKIKESSLNLDDVIKDLSRILDLRSESHVTEPVDLKVRLRKVTHMLENNIKETDTTLVADFHNAPLISGITTYIDSIFYNLISNAIKYRSPERAPVISIQSMHEDNTYVIRFSDNGIGIDLQKYGDKIFGLYKRFNLEIEGKGLGLYLVKSHVQAMHGQIKIESIPNRGTTFNIILPVIDTTQQNMTEVTNKKEL